MTEPAQATPSSAEPDALEQEVNEAIALCDDDIRVALRATLVANAFLEAQVEQLSQAVSFGFTRGKTSPARRASEKLGPVFS